MPPRVPRRVTVLSTEHVTPHMVRIVFGGPALEDFAAGEKPTITLVEYERRRADVESQAYRNGFTAGQEQAHQEAAKRMADALSVIAEKLGRLDPPRRLSHGHQHRVDARSHQLRHD